MAAHLEYAPDGVIGVLTPQANTTVEPELNILAPPGFGILNARLTSTRTQMQDRLIDYGRGMGACLDQFANAPIGIAAFACTGATYLMADGAEAEALAQITRQRGFEMVTAAQSVLDALGALGATRVGLVSPYGAELNELSVNFWRGTGLEITDCIRIDSVDAAFHPIYAMAGSACDAALGRMADTEAEAAVILGTGLPSLGPILRADPAALPVLSPNLCLMWRCTTALQGEAPTRENLMPWLTGACWADRYRARCAT